MIMIRFSFGQLLLPILLSSCQTNPVNPTVNECVGSSEYYIKNESEYTLWVTFLTTPQLGTKTDSSQVIASQRTGKITQDAAFGYMPKPADTFTALIFSREIDGKKVIVYRKDSVTDEGWVKQKHNPNDPDFGCYSVSYTLTVTNQEVK